MSPRLQTAAVLFAGLLPFPLAAQSPAPEHLLRLSLQEGTFYYRKVTTAEAKLGAGVTIWNTLELTLECKVSGIRQGKADLQQTVLRLVSKTKGPDPSSPERTYDSEGGAKDSGMNRLIGVPMSMKIDERGRVGDFSIPTEVASGASPAAYVAHFVSLPEVPVAVGRTWEGVTTMPIPQPDDQETTVVSKLVDVIKGKATIESEVKGAIDKVLLVRGKFNQYRGTMVLDLPTGRIVSARSVLGWSDGDGKVQTSLIEQLELIDPPKPKEGAAEAKPDSGKK
jgi:hypothetical protein